MKESQVRSVDPTAEWLKSGRVQCDIAINIMPWSSIKRQRDDSGSVEGQKKSIRSFLLFVSCAGVPYELELHEMDLYAEENMSKVIKCLHAFANCVPTAVP